MSGRRTRVKICGLTRPQDAEAAVRSGADMVGCVFAPGPRRVTYGQAAVVLADVPSDVVRVGVFVDEDPTDVVDIARTLGLTMLQLHGSETPEECHRMPLPVIKAFRVGEDDPARDIGAYDGSVSAVLLDALVPGAAGGTGVTFDWDVVAALHVAVPVIVAGGLTPANVGEAIRRLRPWAVDVSSGVESSPGLKDHDAMAGFTAAVRAADGKGECRDGH